MPPLALHAAPETDNHNIIHPVFAVWCPFDRSSSRPLTRTGAHHITLNSIIIMNPLAGAFGAVSYFLPDWPQFNRHYTPAKNRFAYYYVLWPFIHRYANWNRCESIALKDYAWLNGSRTLPHSHYTPPLLMLLPWSAINLDLCLANSIFIAVYYIP